jgi:hypothetical protein
MRRRSKLTPKVPKTPKQAKAKFQKPKPSILHDTYKKLITANVAVRLAAFEEAMVWWDQAIPYFLSKAPLTAVQQKYFAQANKARTMAMTAAASTASSVQQSGTDSERENAYKMTITKYQTIWPGAPKLDKVWQKFQAQKDILSKRDQELSLRFQYILDALNTAFQPLGLTFQVHKSEKPRQFDGQDKILISSELAKSLVAKSKVEGMLPVLFSEAHTALYASAIDRGPDGQPITKLDKLARNVPVMMESMLRYINSVPRNKVFRQFADSAQLTATIGAAPTAAPKAPRTPRAPGSAPSGLKGRAAGVKVGGRYIPGSAMAMLFERLCDQQPHKLADIFVGLPTQDPMGRLKWIIKHGQETGVWTCTVTGQEARMEIHKPV